MPLLSFANDLLNEKHIINLSEDIHTFLSSDSRNKHLVNKTEGLNFLKSIYPIYKKRYEWYRRTQWGEIEDWGRISISKEAYRWRGRNGYHTLTSGLDDYPRSPEPHQGELHLDLLCWIAHMASSMKEFANTLGLQKDSKVFEHDYEELLKSLHDLHWDKESGVFADLSVDELGKHLLIDFDF